MKTQKMNYRLKWSLIPLLIVMMTFSSCENKNSNDSENSDTIEAPEMDAIAAAFIGDERTIKQHIAAKSDLNVKDAYGSTALTVAITFGKSNIAKLLIEGGADINMTSADGSTPLHTAAFFGHTEIVEALLANDIDTSIKNNFSVTALESTEVPFEDVKLIYDQIGKDLGALGLKMQYKKIKAARPVIAEMIRNAE